MKNHLEEFKDHWQLIKSKILSSSLERISKERISILQKMNTRGMLNSGMAISEVIENFFKNLRERKSDLIQAFKNLIIQKNFFPSDDIKKILQIDLETIFDPEIALRSLYNVHILKESLDTQSQQLKNQLILEHNPLNSDLELLWLELKDHFSNRLNSKANLKAFLSYSTKNKLEGRKVKAKLKELGIDCFLAHEDLIVSEEWKKRIIQELQICDFFIPILSAEFKSSDWCSQEIGLVSQRSDVIFIPLSLDGTVSFGFISHIQSQKIQPSSLSEEFFKPLIDKHPIPIIPHLIKRLEKAGTFAYSESLLKLLEPHFCEIARQGPSDPQG
ncbi:MAG: toll/interleukin-1 receptor domain-containing protein [Deltaproteobacteria bacterium]|nr:toll/interleukin-1 receptor domain-containing protein [Deltaproteobacteria bacterium]